MNDVEKIAYIDAVEIALDWFQDISKENYELYKQLIKERENHAGNNG